MTENTSFDIEGLLAGTLDDLADMPEFKAYPAGTYQVGMKLINKTAKKDQVNNHPGFELKLKVKEVIELKDAEKTPPAVGDETGILYLLDNELGQGSFKNLMKAAAAHFGNKSLAELALDVNGAEAIVITKVRSNKDKTQEYTDLVEVQFV